MARILRLVLALVVLAGAGFWWLSRPQPLEAAALAGLSGDAERGAHVFDAAGCAGCHSVDGAEGEAWLVLSGGREFPSPFGTFVAPNISPDPTHGIGGWSVADLANAMLRGLSPDGRHYYPAFPYTTYVRASLQDVADLHAYLMTLPPSAEPSRPHAVGFPFNVRRGLGLWKRRYLDDAPVLQGPLSPEAERGRYLVEALAHCGECHTPRDRFGGPIRDAWLAGAPAPDGDGRVPNLRPGALDWSERDLAAYFSSGFTPDFDVAGGLMFDVIQSLRRLPPEDHAALAAYLKALPAAP
ncbi:MAG: c-type cytochrome [Rhodobacteraceae bacterium]|nr:c-type cytochrome [Paracoccaceae bacterium]